MGHVIKLLKMPNLLNHNSHLEYLNLTGLFAFLLLVKKVWRPPIQNLSIHMYIHKYVVYSFLITNTWQYMCVLWLEILQNCILLLKWHWTCKVYVCTQTYVHIKRDSLGLSDILSSYLSLCCILLSVYTIFSITSCV